jgi:Rrf2 family protein
LTPAGGDFDATTRDAWPEELHRHARVARLYCERTVIRLNTSTMLALYAMYELALASGRLLSAAEIAQRYGASEHHVAKVLQQLSRAGICRSVRGAAGGFRLDRDPRAVTMLEVVELFEPRRADARIAAHAAARGLPGGAARIGEVLGEIDEQTHYTLQSISIATLVAPRRPD